MATKKAPTTQLNSWDEKFAASASVAVGKASTVSAGGKTFSIRSGILSFGGVALPNNCTDVIVLDFCAVNTFYEGSFDPKNITSPACFAFQPAEGEDQTMAPHELSTKKQAENCFVCGKNAFGSAIRDGKPAAGKACNNLRRLALIPAGANDKNGRFTPFKADDIDAAGIAYLHVSPTSNANWDTYVKLVGNAMKRPPYGVMTRISVKAHPTKQHEIVFECIGNISNEVAASVMSRVTEAEGEIRFPYSPTSEPQAAATVKKGARGARY